MSSKIKDILVNKFKDDISFSEDSNYIIINNPKKWSSISKFLFKNKDLKFDYLMCLSGYDLTDNKLGVAYNFYSTKLKHYLEVRIEVAGEDPKLFERYASKNS